MSDTVDLLIKILFDKSAREDEKHDAVMDIGQFNDDRALNALVLIANDPSSNQTILDACGESIAQIWMKRNQFDIESYNKFPPIVQQAIRMYIKNQKTSI